MKQKKQQDIFSSPAAKREYNRILFSGLAERYDRVNRFLSLGCDQRWKDRLIDTLPEGQAVNNCLDIACGTGDLTIRLSRKYPAARITGIDICREMLEVAKQREGWGRTTFVCADMMETGFADESVDIITAGYALRNAPDIQMTLKEMFRILRPGGTAALLEFSRLSNRWLFIFQYGILWIWGSIWGLLLQRSPRAYQYIAESLKYFPDYNRWGTLLQKSGFSICSRRRLLFGFAELTTVQKSMP